MNKLPSWWKYDKPYAIVDCLESMKKLPSNCVDLILTDPPYGIGEASKNHMSRGKHGFGGNRNQLGPGKDYGSYEWDNTRIRKEYFDEMFRISKQQVIFGGNYYIDYLYPGPSWIVWDKDNGQNDFADCELAWTSHNKAVRKYKWKWHGMLQQDMSNKEERFHATQKPVPLFKWILERYSKVSDIVLDPFLGSGTTIKACNITGRTGLGFEINPDYERIIIKRLTGNFHDGFEYTGKTIDDTWEDEIE